MRSSDKPIAKPPLAHAARVGYRPHASTHALPDALMTSVPVTSTESPANAVSQARAAFRELPALGWAFAYFFCLLTGYYVLRPVREAMSASSDVAALFPQPMIDWFAARGLVLGEFVLQTLYTCTFIIMLLLQPVYGALVSRFPRRVFLPVIYAFFIACLLVFHVAFTQEWPGRGMAFFLWLTVFNLFAVTVFWSFMADVFSDVQARRVYGFIGAGGTIGAFLGPTLVTFFVKHAGIANLMLISAGFLIACTFCIFRLRPYAVARETTNRLASGEVPMGGSVLAGLKLIAKEPLLRAMALLQIAGVGVGSLLYSEQNIIARTFYPDDVARAAFFGWIDLGVNGLALVIQLLFTRTLLSRYGVAPAILIPIIGIMIGFSLLAASPLPIFVAMTQIASRAGEFSLNKPARETIFTRVGREWRYKAGAAIDTVVYRGGDLTFVWLHKLFSTLGGSTAVFLAGIATSVGFLFAGLQVIREQKHLPATDATESERAP